MQVTSGGRVSERTVEKQISRSLQEQFGRAPERIDCPGSLRGDVGTTMRCTLEDGGVTLGVTVTVTAVKDGGANFDIEVDEKPQG